MEDQLVKVLLVEDDEDDYLLTEDLLEDSDRMDVELEWIDDYASGIEAICRGEYDVCLLDYRLGGENGLDLLREALERGCRTPMVLLTGQGDYEVDVEAMQSGASDYLVKGQLDTPLLERTIQHSVERARVLEELRQSEERYALAVSGASDGIWDWNLKTDEIYFSPRWKTMLGLEEDEVGDDPEEWFGRIHDEDREHVEASLKDHLEGETAHFESEHRMICGDESHRWVLNRGLAVKNDEGEAYRMAGSQTDITERKEAEEQLRHEAYHDDLTGLPNRNLFLQRLGEALECVHEHDEHSFAVLFLDLDRFKVINDSLGHEVGDELIVAVGERLKTCLGPDDTLARFGGDEYAILVDDVGKLEEVTYFAQRIQDEVQKPFTLSDREAYTTTSIGVAISAPSYEEPEELLRDADAAMYRAKELGKARYEIFDNSLREAAVSLLQIESDLRQALENEEFETYYQPILSAETGAIVGSEALVRWIHPERGMVSPAEFIPVAEETGLILEIGVWMLRNACKQHKIWEEKGYAGLFTSVNVSAQQFQHQDLPALLDEILEETGIEPGNLHLEVTESLLMNNLEATIETLNELISRGAKASIDDFGTEYSSLGYLKRFPIHHLKIDRSFIQGLEDNLDQQSITKAIIALAHSLELEVIAEGVELEEHLSFLRGQKCEFVQGFLFSKAVPANDFEALMRKEDYSRFVDTA